MSGLDFRTITEMCGTSITQIERTYYHLNDTIRLTNAVADYRVDSDGTIRVVWTVGVVLTQSESLPTDNSAFSSKITINYSSN